jgi:hypothetical protein
MMAKAKLDADLRLKKHYDNEVEKGIRALMVETAKEAGITRMDFTQHFFADRYKVGEHCVAFLPLCNLAELYNITFGEEFKGRWQEGCWLT